VDAGTGGIQGEGNMVGLRMFSYFGRINYAFMQKYLFEVNFRADASSRFKEGNRWGYFPGFSAGWRLSEEEAIKNWGLFSNLKLRASWGQLGNQNIAGYWPYLPVFTQNNSLSYSYNGTLSPGAAVTAMVEPGITWETTTTLNFGIDAGFFNNRFNIEADYFRKKTSDIIVQLPIPLILGGISAPNENVGEMLNKGFELTLSYNNRQTDSHRFGYNIGLNFTYVDNKVTKFRKDAPDQLFLIREGHSYRTLYGYKATGVYQSDEEARRHMHANGFTPKAGHLKFEDVNTDGKLDYLDKQELGNTIPKITYGLTAKFNYRNFDLSMLFQGVMIGHLYTQSGYTRMDYMFQTISANWRNAWTPENTGTNIPAVRFGSWDNSENSFWVHRSDFLKLKNIQLGYMLPQTVSSRIGMSKMYMYANAQNVFTLMMFKGYEGFDPERQYDGDGSHVYPVARVVSFGINLTF
jgi:TonB-linked SusC/RagA family outer membrane protein